MTLNANLHAQLALLPGYLRGHVVLCGAALGLGLCVSLPLALAVARSPRARGPVMAAVSIFQTIPGLALLALMVPLLGAFGFWPALTALVLYSMLPIVRNTVTGIAQVDPELVEAGRGLGMTERQVLTRVQLPLALPVIVAGVRTAAVWVVGIATLSTPVGQVSLGNFIFGGLQTRNWAAVGVGCAAAAALALALDGLLALLERAARGRSRRRLGAALAGLALVFGGGALAPRLTPASPSAEPAPRHARARGDTSPVAPIAAIRVGAKAFTEQYILAALLTQRLEGAGLKVEAVTGLGSTIAFNALTKNRIDVYVDYTGTLWSSAMKRSDPAPSWRVQSELAGWLATTYGVRDLGALGFQNTYALAMRRAQAQALGIRTIDDLARHAHTLRLGTDYEFLQRPEWTHLREAYGLRFASKTAFDPTFMYQAVAREQVDVITAFSTDGRIDTLDLVTLDDDRRAFPPYQAVVLLSPRAADDRRVIAALTPLLGALSLSRMRAANASVDRSADKKTPAQAARALWPGPR